MTAIGEELETGTSLLVVEIGQIPTEIGGLEDQPDTLTGVEVVCVRIEGRATPLVQLRLAIAGGAQLVAVLNYEEAEELADLLMEATEVEVVAPVLH